jgi:hypothetical protein
MALDFNDVNGGAKKSEVTYMKLVDGDNTFRILPKSVLPGYQYWVTGANGKDLPFECLQYDRENERFDNTRQDPVKELGLKNDKGEDLRCQWSYKCQVINKATGKIEVLQLKKGIMSGVIDVAKQMGIDPTNLETGTWFTVTREKTGPHVFNVEYKIKQLMCKSEALTESELELVESSKSMEELFPVETYEGQKERLERHLSGAKAEEETPKASDMSANEAIDELNS